MLMSSPERRTAVNPDKRAARRAYRKELFNYWIDQVGHSSYAEIAGYAPQLEQPPKPVKPKKPDSIKRRTPGRWFQDMVNDKLDPEKIKAVEENEGYTVVNSIKKVLREILRESGVLKPPSAKQSKGEVLDLRETATRPAQSLVSEESADKRGTPSKDIDGGYVQPHNAIYVYRHDVASPTDTGQDIFKRYGVNDDEPPQHVQREYPDIEE